MQCTREPAKEGAHARLPAGAEMAHDLHACHACAAACTTCKGCARHAHTYRGCACVHGRMRNSWVPTMSHQRSSNAATDVGSAHHVRATGDSQAFARQRIWPACLFRSPACPSARGWRGRAMTTTAVPFRLQVSRNGNTSRPRTQKHDLGIAAHLTEACRKQEVDLK